ncbi:MAG: sirohydrochlorin chelatase [Burkholderiaceae bacterium]
MSTSALILFAHGSRDAAWYAPFEALCARLKTRMPQVDVRLAYLEFGQPALPQAIADAATLGLRAVRVVPVFLAAGKHLREDLPLLIDAARKQHPQLAITLAPPIGEDARMLDAMADVIAGT